MAYLDDYVTTKKPNISLDIPNDIQLDSRFGLEYGQATRIAQEFEKKERELSESKQEMQEMANKIKEDKQKQMLGFKKDMEKKAEEYQQKLAKQEKSKREVDAKLKMTEQALTEKSVTYKTLQAKHETLQSDYTKVVNHLGEVNREKSILEDTTRKMQYRISCLQQEKVDMDGKYKCMTEKQDHEITRLREAEQSLLTRLSKIAGDRFTHDNVNIADLSDADRPTKLSETYSELYDNEWTDAFEELTEDMKLSDEDAIRLLLKILMDAFRKCKEITWDRYESLKLVASTLEVKQEKLSSIITEEKQEGTFESKECSTLAVYAGLSIKDKCDNDTQTDEVSYEGTFESKECSTLAISAGLSIKDMCDHDTQTDEVSYEGADEGKESSLHAMSTVHHINDNTNNNTQTDQTTVAVTFQGNDCSLPAMSTGLSMKFMSEKDTQTEERTVDGKDCSSDPMSERLSINDTIDADTQTDETISMNVQTKTTSLRSTLSIDQDKSLKNIWRATSCSLQQESLKLLYAELSTSLCKYETELPKTYKYLTVCTDLCWKMGVQEKPMHLDLIAEKQVGQEKQFDTDKFRAYTKTGKSVSYVVWPALILHEGGAMLAKGIAQGCPNVLNV